MQAFPADPHPVGGPHRPLTVQQPEEHESESHAQLAAVPVPEQNCPATQVGPLPHRHPPSAPQRFARPGGHGEKSPPPAPHAPASGGFWHTPFKQQPAQFEGPRPAHACEVQVAEPEQVWQVTPRPHALTEVPGMHESPESPEQHPASPLPAVHLHPPDVQTCPRRHASPSSRARTRSGRTRRWTSHRRGSSPTSRRTSPERSRRPEGPHRAFRRCLRRSRRPYRLRPRHARRRLQRRRLLLRSRRRCRRRSRRRCLHLRPARGSSAGTGRRRSRWFPPSTCRLRCSSRGRPRRRLRTGRRPGRRPTARRGRPSRPPRIVLVRLKSSSRHPLPRRRGAPRRGRYACDPEVASLGGRRASPGARMLRQP